MLWAYTIYKSQTKQILGKEGCENSRMIITGHFQPSLLTWKDQSKGTIQDFHGQAGAVGLYLPDPIKKKKKKKML